MSNYNWLIGEYISSICGISGRVHTILNSQLGVRLLVKDDRCNAHIIDIDDLDLEALRIQTQIELLKPSSGYLCNVVV